MASANEVHVEPDGVCPLHKLERAYLDVADRAQAKLTLRAPTQRALQGIGEGVKNIGTQSSDMTGAMSPASSTKGSEQAL